MQRFFGKITKLGGNQVGAASIYVSLTIMVILSLIVLTFFNIMFTNFKQIQESQYHLQAYYAAESGINDVRAEIHESIRHTTQDKDADTNLTIENITTNNPLSIIMHGLTDQFGAAVAIQDEVLIVGAPGKDSQGVVYIFKWNKTKKSWEKSQTINSDSIEDNLKEIVNPSYVALQGSDDFGAAVSIEGNFLFVGAPGNNSNNGAVYMFYREEGIQKWVFSQKLILVQDPNDPVNDTYFTKITGITGSASKRFGAAIVIRESKLFVGAPGTPADNGEVYVIGRIDDRGWKSSQSRVGIASEQLGASLAFSNSRLMVGAPGYKSSGITLPTGGVYIFSESSGSINFGAPIEIYDKGPSSYKNSTVGNLSGGEKFGSSVAASGSVIIAGAPGTDSNKGGAYIFEKDGLSWYWRSRIIDDTSSPPPQKTHVVTPLRPDDLFGQSMYLAHDLLVVGAPGQNKVYFFKVETNDILNDILAGNLNQDCPSEQDAHPAWQDGALSKTIRYLCIGVDVAPKDLIYDRVGLDRSLILNLEPVDKNHEGVNLDTLTIEWDHTDLTEEYLSGTSAELKPGNAWGNSKIPLLRVQIIPIDTEKTFNRDTLNGNSRVFFLYPNEDTSNSPVWPALNADGKIIGGDCKKGKGAKELPCEVTVGIPKPDNIHNGQPADAGHQLVYVVRIQSIYNPARIKVTGIHSSSKDALFKNVQAVITATGRSNHIAERLRERIPLSPVYDWPEYAIDSAGNLCKILASDDYYGVYLFDKEPLEGLTGEESCSLRR